MAGRTAAEAVNNFLEALHKVISCVTDTHLSVRGGYRPTTEEPHVLVLGDGLPQKLRGTDLSLVLRQRYYVIKVEDPNRGPWKVSTAEYDYNFRDSETRVVIAYHWHPGGRQKVRRPHLHLDRGAEVGRQELHRAHIPTGRVAIEDVIRFAINELGVEPRRDDWEQILDQAQRVHETWRTWP